MFILITLIFFIIQMFNFKQWLILIVMIAVSIQIDPQLDKHIMTVYGNASLGYYYINLYIGSPPQKQSVIIDTGSGQLALPCSQCTSCGNKHLQKPFDLRKSSTSKIMTCNSKSDACKDTCYQSGSNPCTFSISYAEGSSLFGVLIEDQIQFEPDSSGEAITTIFGCTTKETNLFYTQAANGIFGLAPKRKARLLQLLYEKHSKYTGEQFLFSMCLSKNGGQIAIGKIKEQLIINKTSVKTKFDPYRNLYSLKNVGKIQMGKTTLFSNSDFGYYGIFIDSGSTFTYFRQESYLAFLRQVQNSCAYSSNKCKMAQKSALKCYQIQPALNQSLVQALQSIFPSIDIQINGQIVKWLPNRYFVSRSHSKDKEVCLGVQSLDRFLLGGNWMADRNIVFNLKQETVQIFSQVKCTQSAQILDLPLQYEDNSGSLTYISAVLNIDEGLLYKIIEFVLIVVIIVFFLVGLGLYVFKKQRQEIVATKKKNAMQLKQEENSAIINIKSETQSLARSISSPNEEATEKSIQSE